MANHCLYCDRVLVIDTSWSYLLFHKEAPTLCDSCTAELIQLIGDVCTKCNRLLSELNQKFIKDGICSDCMWWGAQGEWSGMLEKNRSLYMYNDFLKALLARFKYRGDYVLAKVFSGEVKKILQIQKKDLITPIPLSTQRLYERGFNQASAIISEAGVIETAILTRIHSEKQSKKSRSERINTEQVFQVTDPLLIKGKSILLVDDIYTTGATLHHAAKVLKEAGAKEISAFTLARG